MSSKKKSRVEWETYENYIEPDYKIGDNYRGSHSIRCDFNNFSNGLIEKDFGDAKKLNMKPVNNTYNIHMINFLSHLDAAKDEYAKAVFAFFCDKDSTPVVSVLETASQGEIFVDEDKGDERDAVWVFVSNKNRTCNFLTLLFCYIIWHSPSGYSSKSEVS